MRPPEIKMVHRRLCVQQKYRRQLEQTSATDVDNDWQHAYGVGIAQHGTEAHFSLLWRHFP